MTRVWTFRSVTAVVLAAVTGLLGCSQNTTAESAANDSKPSALADTAGPASKERADAGAFDVVDLAAFEELLKSHRGKTVVVNFWATWCPPCVAEMPEFAEFYREHEGDDKVVLLSLTADDPSTLDSAIKPFVEKYEIPFPIRIMDFMPSEELARVLGYDWVDGNLPATFVFKPDGTLQNVWFVQIKKADLDKAVTKASAQA